MEEKKLGLKSVISVSVGLVIATSCLVSLGQGAGTIGVTFIFAMVIACLFNMTTIASLSELNDAEYDRGTGTVYACLPGTVSNDDFHGGRVSVLQCIVFRCGSLNFCICHGRNFSSADSKLFLYRSGDGYSSDCQFKGCGYWNIRLIWMWKTGRCCARTG